MKSLELEQCLAQQATRRAFLGRAAQGVRVIRLEEDDEIASIAKVEVDEEKDVPGNESVGASPEAAAPSDEPAA